MCLSLNCVGEDKQVHLNRVNCLTMSENDVVAGMRGDVGSARVSGWNLVESWVLILYHLKFLLTP